MVQFFKSWMHKYFSDPQAILLVIILLFSFGIIIALGNVLAPVIASLVIAYFLKWWVNVLSKYKCPRRLAYIGVYLGFVAVFVSACLIIMPLLWKQFIGLFTDLPSMLQSAKAIIIKSIEKYPEYFSEQQIDALISALMQDIQSWAKKVLTVSLSSIPGVITWIVYMILIPILVFFFLKDSIGMISWITSFLPQERTLFKELWRDMDKQIGNYVRGKIMEIIIVWVFTYAIFIFFGLKYSVLLASLVGLSVIVPYVGAVVVTIPVALVGYIQWGWSDDFIYMFSSYLLIQALDGNLLVPLLFSGVVNLHPVAIIVAILIFGSIWGFWGVFFAIPLATLFKSILYSWPKESVP